MPGLMCIRDVDSDSKAFAAMDMLPFSTTSAAGHEVQLSARYALPKSPFCCRTGNCKVSDNFDTF